MPSLTLSARRALLHICLTMLIGVSMLLSPQAAFAAGTPTVTLDAPPETMIGEPVKLNVLFDNIGASTGYGPYIDLVLPAAGADGAGAATDDGITFAGAAYLGQTLAPIAPSPFLCTSGTFTHPLTRLPTTCTIGTQVVVLQLPFGSFTPDQPQALISVTANLSNLADVGTPLTISATPGFLYGNDPLNNPATDPPISGAATTDSTTPTLIKIKKTYLGPEDETAIGPNFPRQYLLEVNIASGQTVTNLDVTDLLPNNLQFISLVSTTIRGTATATTAISTPSTTIPGGTLTRRFASVTGTTAINDATLLFSFYVPRVDAGSGVIIDPASGDDVPSPNEASALGNWTPVDTRDPGGAANAAANLPGPEHTLIDKSIAIQKFLRNVTDPAYSPGDVLEYRLEFQVSDFFAFGNVAITDHFSDGQRFDVSFPPTLLLNGNGYTLASTPINAANFTVDTSQIGNDSNPATDGSTTVTFRVSNELLTRGQPSGRLIGGCVPTAGTGGPAPACAGYNDGATTGTLIFRTVLQENFSDTYPSGDPSVDQGDVFRNNVQIDGAVLNTSTLAPTGQSEADASATEAWITNGTLSKSIYAVNGVVCATQPCPSVRIAPGHTVTYRIRYTLPTSDFEDLDLVDYLPLPIFNATEVATFNTTASAAAPAAGVAKLGPADTYHLQPAAVTPTLSTTGPGVDNTITFAYGDYDSPTSSASQIDLLFTVTALGTPFADRLFLTNQVHAHENATNSGPSDMDAIVQVQLTEPLLQTRKGVIATSGASGTFTPATVAPVVFSAPGGGCPRFTGTITSTSLAATPINSNLTQAQAGERISFAVVVENIGSGLNGAFDVRIRDTIPAGFTIPAGAPGLNLCVTNGAGTALPFTNLGTGFFDAAGGIELIDPGANSGALGAGRDVNNVPVTTGQNIAIITYDLQLMATVTPDQLLTNTGTVYNYASLEGGGDFTPTDLTDTATVRVAQARPTKSIVATSEGSTSEAGTPRAVTIGEIVRYRLVVQMPESTSTNFYLLDRLPTGVRFLNDGTSRAALVFNGAGLTSSTITPALPGCAGLNMTGNTSAATPTCPLPDTAISNSATTNTDTYTSGTDVYFKFGNLTNNDADTDAEFVIVEFNAIVDNTATADNQSGVIRGNDFVVNISGVTQQISPVVDVIIAEPSITNVDKVALTPTGDAGDTVTFRVTYSNATGATVSTAFETRLTDTLPAGLTLNIGSIAVTLGGGANGIANSSAGNTIDITIAAIPPGGTVQVQYSATIQTAVTPGQLLTNTANVVYTSLPGPTGTTSNPTGSTTPDPTGGNYGERNGAGTPPINNYNGSDPATITIVPPTPVKSTVATSAGHTGNAGGTERVAVGEIVRYRLAVQLPEATSANFQLRDELPAGMQFLNDGSARAVLVANESGIVSSTLADPSLSDVGNESTIGAITPVFALPDTAVSTNATTNDDAYADGSDVYFKLGTLNNNDSDVDQEFVVVEFNALVLNVVPNQSGTLLSNTFSVFIGGANQATSPGLSVGVAEPLINLAKTINSPAAGTPIDAGDAISYNLVVTNIVSGDSAAAAFDLRLRDVLDANLVFQGLSVTKPAYAVVTDTTAGNTVDLVIDRLNPGDSVTVVVTANVSPTAQPGLTIPNTADATYTSLPGASGTTPNPTGSTTPGGSGSGTGERNGNDGSIGPLNDYAARSGINLSLTLPAIDKLAPTPTQYTIGETVSYDILVTLPEGSITGLVLRDNVPDGLAYLSHSLITTAAASNGRLTQDYGGDIASLTATRTSPTSAPGASGEDLALSFPTATTTADNNADNNRFVLRVVARVLNIATNNEGTTLSNSASLRYTDPVSGNPLTLSDVPVDISVVEPQLTISKSTLMPSAAIGELITYSIVVEHPGGDTETAYDVQISDTLPAGLTYEPGSIRIVSGSPSGTTDDSAAPLLRWRFPAIAPGETATVEFDARISTSANPTQPIRNTAAVVWTSLSGASPDERTGADGPGGALNDYAAGSSADVVPSAYTLSKTLVTPAGGLAQVGDPIRFSIVITNTGGTELLWVPVTDTYDTTYLSYVGATPASDDNIDDGAIDWADFGPIPVGESRTILVDFTARAGVVRTTNVATTSDVIDEHEVGLPPATASANVMIGQPDLVISKSDGGVSTTPSGMVAYTLSYSNVGSIGATGVVVTETVPANSRFNAGLSTAGWSCADGAPAGTTCTLTVGTLAAGATGSATFTVTVDTPLPTGVTQLTNTSTIADDGANGADPTPANNSASDITPISAAPDLWILKSTTTKLVVPGAPITYTLSYGNRGNKGATGVVVTETVPANSRFNAGLSTAGWSCADGAPAGTTCTLTVGTLAAGATGSATFAMTIDTPLPDSVKQLTNIVTIADDGANGADPTPSDNTSQVVIVYDPTAIVLASFTATHQSDGILVRWQTLSEIDTYGFDLYRSTDTDRAHAERITPQTILGQGRTSGGASYAWLDTEIVPGMTYTYWLQETETDADKVEYGPVTARHLIFIPFTQYYYQD